MITWSIHRRKHPHTLSDDGDGSGDTHHQYGSLSYRDFVGELGSDTVHLQFPRRCSVEKKRTESEGMERFK